MTFEYEDDPQAYADDLAAQNAAEDAKYDFPPQEEPPEGYYDAPEWLVAVRTRGGDVAVAYSDETPDVEGETELTEETAWAVASAINLVGAKLLDEAGTPMLSARVLHLGDPQDQRSEGVRAGSVSPTDPAALGEWLRALPHRTILRDRSGDPCLRETGMEHGLRSVRHFPALFILGDPFEISADRENNVDDLARYAPFTVLALGDGAS